MSGWAPDQGKLDQVGQLLTACVDVSNHAAHRQALDMLEQGNEASLNASGDKSSEMETSPHSAGTHSDGNPFGSPAAAVAPQVRRSCPPWHRVPLAALALLCSARYAHEHAVSAAGA